MSTLENCLISTYWLWFSTRVQMKKKTGDTPSATLIKKRLCKWGSRFVYASSHLDTVGYPGLKFKNDVIMLSSLLFQNKAVLYYFKSSGNKNCAVYK